MIDGGPGPGLETVDNDAALTVTPARVHERPRFWPLEALLLQALVHRDLSSRDRPLLAGGIGGQLELALDATRWLGQVSDTGLEHHELPG